jgi:hypothetical protein
MKITDTGNNIYYYIVIPNGNYDQTSLQSVIIQELNNSGINVGPSGMSFSIINGYAAFAPSSGQFTIDFAVKTNYKSSTSTTTPYSNDFDKYKLKSKLGWLLGYRNISYISSPFVPNILSEQLIDLNRLRYVYLVVDEFSSNSPNSFISPFSTSILNKNILAKISLDLRNFPFGTILPANYSNGHLQSDKRTYSGKVNLQKLNVQLVNEYGVQINLNGSDFSFCLEIEYE